MRTRCQAEGESRSGVRQRRAAARDSGELLRDRQATGLAVRQRLDQWRQTGESRRRAGPPKGDLSMANLPDRFLFMKVGNHANETWEQILERKRKEYDRTGRTFWGYGGTTCHPLGVVQPFARL